MKKYNKISILGILLAIFTVVSISLSTLPAISAQEQAAPATSGTKCITEMRPFMDQKNKELQEYFKANFSNKSTNSSLLDLALTRLKLYRNDLTNKYMTYYAQSGTSLQTEAMDTLSCYQEMQKEIVLNEELLKKYFTQTSNIKTSSALTQKLKAINSKLDKLATSVAQMWGKYETLNNNVPCIIDKCI